MITVEQMPINIKRFQTGARLNRRTKNPEKHI